MPHSNDTIEHGFPWGTFLLIAFNSIVFVAMCVQDQSLLLPSDEILDAFGVKSNLALLAGEWWRLITPAFLHIGVIHFVVNMLALFYIGRVIEVQTGTTIFLLCYLWCALNGVIASYLFTFGDSAGASGAIFGLAGLGLGFERMYLFRSFGWRGLFRRGPFTTLVLLNLMIGFVLSGSIVRFDNAAHLGGLLTGFVAAFVILFGSYNNLVPRRRGLALALLFCMILLTGLASRRLTYISW